MISMHTEEARLAEEYLEEIPSFARKKSSLLKVREFLGLLGNPDQGFSIVHVAGTNGKGSVCAFLTSILKEADIPCGTFISPHLADIRERFLINGEMTSEETFVRAFRRVREAVASWMEKGNPHPTYFEFLFYMGLLIFREAEIQTLILETGMGGRYDVTNVIEAPMVTVITSIGIDHTAFLGDTISQIASHKAGILKLGCPVVYDGTGKEAGDVIRAKARLCGSPGYEVKEVPFRFREEADGLEINWPYDGQQETFFIPIAAPYQAVNGALAVKAAEVLKAAMGTGAVITAQTVRNGLAHTYWPARMEPVFPDVYLDGAHNEAGIQAFLEAACEIKKRKKPERIWLLFAVSADKDYRQMLKETAKKLSPDVIFLTAADSARALSGEELRAAAEEAFSQQEKSLPRMETFPTTAQALHELLKEKKERDLVFIAGSLYLAGEVKKERYHD